MSNSKHYRERASLFTTLAAAANNEPMARLYAAMAAEYLARADGEEPSGDSVPAIILVPAALADHSKR